MEVRKETEVSIWDTDHFIEPAVASYKYEQYVWSGRYIDAPVLRRWNSTSPISDNTFEATYYYTTDANMNVTAELSTAGAVQERYTYTPYGEVAVLDEDWTPDDGTPDHGNSILYCGYYRDAETGLYHVRFRMYHAQLGRFTTRDPVGYLASLSLYLYAIGEPVTHRDPSGLMASENDMRNLASELSEWLDVERHSAKTFGGGKRKKQVHFYRLSSWVLGLHTKRAMVRGVGGGIIEGSLKGLSFLGAPWYVAAGLDFVINVGLGNKRPLEGARDVVVSGLSSTVGDWWGKKLVGPDFLDEIHKEVSKRVVEHGVETALDIPQQMAEDLAERIRYASMKEGWKTKYYREQGDGWHVGASLMYNDSTCAFILLTGGSKPRGAPHRMWKGLESLREIGGRIEGKVKVKGDVFRVGQTRVFDITWRTR